MKNQPNNILLMTKTLIAKTSIFKHLPLFVYSESVSVDVLLKKRLIWKQSIQQKTN